MNDKIELGLAIGQALNDHAEACTNKSNWEAAPYHMSAWKRIVKWVNLSDNLMALRTLWSGKRGAYQGDMLIDACYLLQHEIQDRPFMVMHETASAGSNIVTEDDTAEFAAQKVNYCGYDRFTVFGRGKASSIDKAEALSIAASPRARLEDYA